MSLSFFFFAATAPLIGWLSDRILTKLFPPEDIYDDWTIFGMVVGVAYIGVGSLFFTF